MRYSVEPSGSVEEPTWTVYDHEELTDACVCANAERAARIAYALQLADDEDKRKAGGDAFGSTV